ncbi:hypothetical protein EBU94_08190 [bacterium]|nr:hypothetical protein [bacterium]
MPKSKQRKDHKKKVQKRNNVIKAQQKYFQEQMNAQIEELRKEYMAKSGNTENTEKNEMGLIQPTT